MASLSAEATARLAARAALDKNAEDLVILDLRGLSTVADFFVITSARSTTQADTIVEAARMALKAAGTRPRHQEGSSSWTTSTSSCTSSSGRRGTSTRSSACGATHRSSPWSGERRLAIDFRWGA
jgi:Ribosomal silencing factor during starvation